ncbi:MAG TPA: hypothetical protein V6D26_30835 [Stenomitos sp.]
MRLPGRVRFWRSATSKAKGNRRGLTGHWVAFCSALHLAAYFQDKAPTLLVDGDLNRSALEWASRGELPFKVVDEKQAVKFAREYEHIITKKQNPSN